jgi:hypothetical protein
MMLEDLAAHAHQRDLEQWRRYALVCKAMSLIRAMPISPYPELERVLPAHGVTPQHHSTNTLPTMMRLWLMPDNYLGAWHDHTKRQCVSSISRM